MIRILILLAFTTHVHAWGVPATATTTVEARVTNWTEDPCMYGDRFAAACEYAQRHNLFPGRPTEPTGGWSNTQIPQTTQTDNITNYE